MEVVLNQNPMVGELVARAIPGMHGVNDWGQHFVAVGFNLRRRLVAGAVFTNYTGFDVTVSMAGFGRCRITKEMLRFIADLCFNQWNCVRLTAIISRRNKPGRDFAEKVGFKMEGVKERGYDGRSDAMIYGLQRHTCRWLEKEHAS